MANDNLKEAFTSSGLPVGHYDAFKAGAAQGYLMAKRQMVGAIDKSLAELNDPPIFSEDRYAIKEFESLRDYIRNVMLWGNL